MSPSPVDGRGGTSFYINLPFGLVAAVFISFFFTNPGQYTPGKAVEWKNRLREFDVLGTALLLPAVICVLLALQWGGSQYPWKDGRIIAFFVLFGVLIIAFAGVQIWKQDKATVPPHVLKQRTVWAAALYATSMSASMFILIYYVGVSYFFCSILTDVNSYQSGFKQSKAPPP